MKSRQAKRIVFLGTPDFAVASLQQLIHMGFNVVAVVTAPDKPAGRGQKLMPSAVKKCAIEHHLPVLQPANLKDEDFHRALANFQADIQVVVAFRMLPESVWNMPPLGTVNVHGSLLPAYRGAAPINWAIINGEKETGVTTFLLKHAIDTGDLLLQKATPIDSSDNAGTIYNRLMAMGASLLVETLDGLFAGEVSPKPQPEAPSQKHAPKLFKADCNVLFNRSAEAIFNHVRGLTPFPGAYGIATTNTENQLMVKLHDCKISFSEFELEPGQVRIENKRLFVGTKTSPIELIEIQLPNKRRMNVADALNGMQQTLTSFETE